MNKVMKEVCKVAKKYGYERLTCIMRMDITRYSVGECLAVATI